jgi:hypothetical protein
LTQVEANPYDYNAHVALIDALRRLADLDSLRQARECMSAVFPLPPDMWLAWIDDEKALAVEPGEKQQVLALFDQALADYPGASAPGCSAPPGPLSDCSSPMQLLIEWRLCPRHLH